MFTARWRQNNRRSQCGGDCNCGGYVALLAFASILLRENAIDFSKPRTALIAEQLRRAFAGDAWHGPALLELLKDIDARTAAAHPLSEVHSIWELVSHIEVWDAATLRRLAGEACQPEGEANFPPMPKPTEAAWRKAVAGAKRTHDRLVKTVAALPDSRLRDQVPGKKYDFQFMLPGVAQHELYHAGQIAILKKAIE